MLKKFTPFGLSILLIFSACTQTNNAEKPMAVSQEFNYQNLQTQEKDSYKKVHGQVLYLPVYSNVPYTSKETNYNLSAFVAIHNTDFIHSIKISKVFYFHNDGHLVANYLHKDTILKPLATTNFYVPAHDQSGTGANFIVEWTADSLVNEPLVESVVTGFTSGQGISFLSTGKILREIK